MHLELFGFRLTRRTPIPSWRHFFGLIKRQRMIPATIFDIGVAKGTPELYKAFPAARYFLIDPSREALPYMLALESELNATRMPFALGDRSVQLEMISRADIGGNSLYEETAGAPDVTGRYTVHVKRFDALFPHFERPALCKIDVQGAELMVLRGMEGVADKIDILIVEVSLIATVNEGAEVTAVIDQAAKLGFVLFDIIALVRRPLDDALCQADFVFVRHDSALRADRRWGYPGQ